METLRKTVQVLECLQGSQEDAEMETHLSLLLKTMAIDCLGTLTLAAQLCGLPRPLLTRSPCTPSFLCPGRPSPGLQGSAYERQPPWDSLAPRLLSACTQQDSLRLLPPEHMPGITWLVTFCPPRKPHPARDPACLFTKHGTIPSPLFCSSSVAENLKYLKPQSPLEGRG